MDKIEFATTERNALQYWRFHHPHPRVQLKMEALYLKSQGLAPEDICRLCSISKTTFYRYRHTYYDGGIDTRKEVPFIGDRVSGLPTAPALKPTFGSVPRPVWPRRPRGLPP